MPPTKISTAIFLLSSGTWSQQPNILASAKVIMDEYTEMEIGADSAYSIGNVLTDLEPDCGAWADLGECHSYPEYMFTHCIKTCLTEENLGTIGYFLEAEDEDEDEDMECTNIHDSYTNEFFPCEELAEWGECHLNPTYMMEDCAKSCLLCLPAGLKTFEIGIRQEVMEEYEDDTKHIESTLGVIAATIAYMSTEIMEKAAYDYVRRSCRNKHEYCSSMAAAGYCEDNDENEYYYFMMTDCAPACQTCDTFQLIETCTPDKNDDSLKKGDLDLMFRRIVGEEPRLETFPDCIAHVHSRPEHQSETLKNHDDIIPGPWVVTLDNFLSDEECDRLIELGEKNSDIMNDYEPEELDNRTSLNSWCKRECYTDPLMNGIIERMSEVTGIPQENSEYLQMLKYSAGREYEEYEEYELSEDSYDHMPGPTVITFLLFLNEVEEGGETHFDNLSGNDNKLSLDIQPKKGTVLIWPSVENDPSFIEERTLHKFMPVTKGVKYGVKASFHLRSFDRDNCDYDAFREFKWW